jgi:hypothetical protein
MEEVLSTPRLVTAQVYASIDHAELGRLLEKYGYDAERFDDDGRPAWRTLTAPRFTALPQSPLRSQPGEFESVFLYAYVFGTPAISAAVVRNLQWKTIFAHLIVHKSGHIAATHSIQLTGGVSERFVREQLWTWLRDLERVRDEIRKQLRKAAGSTLH